MTIFGAHGRIKTDEFGPGQVAFVNEGFGHYIEQVGDEPTKILLIFSAPIYQEINLSSWLAGNPASVIETIFGISPQLVDQLPKKLVGFAART
jgi:oxalate decarboxylase